jgi:adenylate cyclase, class 2
VGTETEVKVSIGDPDDFCRRLVSFHPRIVSERHFEDNCLLDFSDGALKSSRCLIRIRHVKNGAYLTYKGPPEADGIFKTREELETRLDDGILALEIFERIGMRVWFRYQKYRREFELDRVLVSVDETPIGNYAELEGKGKDILEISDKMGISEAQFIRLSYYALYMKECRAKGNPPGNMIF